MRQAALILLSHVLNDIPVLFFAVYCFQMLSLKEKYKHRKIAIALCLFLSCLVLSVMRDNITAIKQSAAANAAVTMLGFAIQLALIFVFFSDGKGYILLVFFIAKLSEALVIVLAQYSVPPLLGEVYTRYIQQGEATALSLLQIFALPDIACGVLYAVIIFIGKTLKLHALNSTVMLLSALIPISQIAMFVIFSFSSGNYRMELYTQNGSGLPMLVVFVVGLLGDVVLFNVMANLMRSTELENRLRAEEAKHRYYAQVEEQQNVTRRMQHDLQNQINVMRRMLEQGSSKGEVSAYLDALEADVSRPRLYYCGSAAINALLVDKRELCEKLDIDVKYDIMLNECGTKLSVVIVAIVSNMLDNAIESVPPAPAKRFIRLEITRKAGALSIICQNTCGGEKTSLNTAKATHGNGKAIITTAAKKYDGDAEFKVQDGMYTSSCVLFVGEEE